MQPNDPAEASGALLSDGARTAYDRALASGGRLGDEVATDHIDELERLGLVHRVDGQWTAQSPARPLGSVIASLHEQSAAVRVLSSELELLWSRHMVQAAPEWRTGRDAGRVVEELLRDARETVRAFVVPPSGGDVPLQMPDAQAPSMARGLTVYGLYSADVLDHPVGLKVAQASMAAGEQARLLHNVPFSATIADRSVVSIIPPYEDYATRRAVMIRDAGLVDCFVRLFDVLWEQAIPLSAEMEVTPDQRDETQLLAMLAQGHSDRAIARHLGISERTLSRRITALQQRLSARTRFQLGFQAARLMLDPGDGRAPGAVE